MSAFPLETMRGSDAVWTQDSPHNLMIINALILCEKMDVSIMQSIWQERVMAGERAAHNARFRKKVVFRGGTPYWQEDIDFDLSRHIFAIPSENINTEADLEALIGAAASQPLPEDRPRWQIQVVEHFGEGSALFIRIHHCIGDGVALIPVLFSIIDEMNEGGHDPHKVSKPLMPAWIRFGLAPLLALPILLSRLLWMPDRSVMHGPKMSGQKRVTWTKAIPIEDVKAVRHKLGMTVNDVLMACIGGAFRRYFVQQNAPIPTQVRTTMPVNLRTAGEDIKLENYFSVAFLELPMGPADDLARAHHVKAHMDKMKRSLQPFIMLHAAALVTRILPLPLARFVLNLFANKTTAVTTNVPGPQQVLHLGGRRANTLLFWVPTRAEIGIGISLLSISGEVRVGILGDTAVLPNPHVLADAFIAEFEALATSS